MFWTIQDRKLIKNTDNTQIRYNSQKPDNAKYSKTELAWFSRLLQQTAKKPGNVGLFYNVPEPTNLFKCLLPVNNLYTILKGPHSQMPSTSLVNTLISLFYK